MTYFLEGLRDIELVLDKCSSPLEDALDVSANGWVDVQVVQGTFQLAEVQQALGADKHSLRIGPIMFSASPDCARLPADVYGRIQPGGRCIGV